VDETKPAEVPPPLHAQLDQEALRKVGRDLVKAFDVLANEFRAAQARRAQALEVAALFEVYRQYRHGGRAEDGLTRAEAAARLSAALRGYEPDYLSDLASFGGYLADAASKELGSR
jgi:hypothetical protein